MGKVFLEVGTGLYNLATNFRPVETDYGLVQVGDLTLGGRECYVTNRHDGLRSPHLVNSAGIVQAARLLDAIAILSFTATGRLSKKAKVGNLGIITDVTKQGQENRVVTYADIPGIMLFLPGTEKYSSRLAKIAIDSWHSGTELHARRIYAGSGLDLDAHLHESSGYHCLNGPNFLEAFEEAEQRLLKGATVLLNRTLKQLSFLPGLKHYKHLPDFPSAWAVGQTEQPARDFAFTLGIPRLSIAEITDNSQYPTSEEEGAHNVVLENMKTIGQVVKELLTEMLQKIPEDYSEPEMEKGIFRYLNPGDIDLNVLKKQRPILTKIIEEDAKRNGIKIK